MKADNVCRSGRRHSKFTAISLIQSSDEKHERREGADGGMIKKAALAGYEEAFRDTPPQFRSSAAVGTRNAFYSSERLTRRLSGLRCTFKRQTGRLLNNDKRLSRTWNYTVLHLLHIQFFLSAPKSRMFSTAHFPLCSYHFARFSIFFAVLTTSLAGSAFSTLLFDLGL